MGDWLGGFKPQQRYYEAKQDNIYVAKPSIRGVDMQRAYSKNPVLVLKNHFNSIKSKIFEKDIAVVKDIIAGDKDAPRKLNRDKMAAMIVEAAYEAKVDPVIIAHIARRESDFNQQANNGTGKGIMQLTPISIKDMYERPDIYEPELRPILKKYGTAEKLFAALKKDPELNIKVGAFLFRAKLNKAGGNVKKALELYNGSKLKYRYADAVMNNINNTKNSLGFRGLA